MAGRTSTTLPRDSVWRTTENEVATLPVLWSTT